MSSTPGENQSPYPDDEDVVQDSGLAPEEVEGD